MPVVLCGLRFFSNLFRHRSSKKVVLGNASTILDAASDQVRFAIAPVSSSRPQFFSFFCLGCFVGEGWLREGDYLASASSDQVILNRPFLFRCLVSLPLFFFLPLVLFLSIFEYGGAGPSIRSKILPTLVATGKLARRRKSVCNSLLVLLLLVFSVSACLPAQIPPDLLQSCPGKSQSLTRSSSSVVFAVAGRRRLRLTFCA